MNWKGVYLSEETQEIPSDLKAKLIGTYDDFLYEQGIETKIVERDNRLYVESQILDMFRSGEDNELVYLKNGLFKITDYPNLLKFEFKDGKLVSVTQIRGELTNKVSAITKLE